MLNLTKDSGSFVKVSIDGKLTDTYDLSVDATYEITGYDGGKNTLVIKDHEAYMTEADCPDQVCVKTGKIHRVGESIVCLPHRAVVEISKEGEEAEVDTVSQ